MQAQSVYSHYAFPFPPNINPSIQYNTTTTAIMIPASFNIATLFPCCAIRPNRPALPFKDVLKFEKTSFCILVNVCRMGFKLATYT